MEENVVYAASDDILHDIRSPLSVIYAIIATLKFQVADSDSFDNSINMLQRNLFFLSKLTDNIWEGNRLIDGTFEVHKTYELLNSSIEEIVCQLQPVSTTKQISIDFYTNVEEQFECYVDLFFIERILRNLLSNAIKFSPCNSKIEVHLTLMKSNFQLSVRDYGIGIAEEDICKIFSEKYTTFGNMENHYTAGEGLGLFIVKQLAHIMDGDVFVQRHDRGTEIGVTIPLN